MAKTASILTEKEWKDRFGKLLDFVASDQAISSDKIGKQLDRMESSGRNRAGDWSRYVKGGRLPTEGQLEQLSRVLRIPKAVMRICAGYVDDIFECSYALMASLTTPEKRLPCSKNRAVFAFLFSLFPNNDMYTGNLFEIWSFVSGRIIRLNLTSEEGFKTGTRWNSTWLYPHNPKPSQLIARRHDPTNDRVTYVTVGGPPPTEPWIEYSLQAKIQTDIASPLAAMILACDRRPIPKTDALFEAQRMMHSKALSLTMRCELATVIIHDWADKIDKKVADEVRRDLNCHDLKTITSAAVSWIEGELAERPDYHDFWL
jgi:hypothetical protein